MSCRDAIERRIARGLIVGLSMGLSVGWSIGLPTGLTIGALVVPATSRAEDRATTDAELEPKPESKIVERWRGATPAERLEMRAQLRERWQAATPRARRRFGRGMKALERKLPDFSAIERVVILRAAARMPEPEREALKGRIAGIDGLEAEQRAQLVDDLKAIVAEYSQEIDRLERNTQRWRGMSRSERDELREQMRRLRGMSVEQRRALLEELERGRRDP